jgi:hypothetical protein
VCETLVVLWGKGQPPSVHSIPTAWSLHEWWVIDELVAIEII